MLKTRVITAVILVVCFLLALFLLPGLWWALLTLAAILVAAHEWCRLWSFTPAQEMAYLASIAAIGALVLFMVPPHAIAVWSFAGAIAFWLLAVPVWFYSGWKPVFKSLAAVAGWIIFVSTWLAMIDLRALGPLWLLAAMALVWIADIAAYFAGRAFGRNKLAPAISPGKTWEGVVGGLTAVLCYTVLVLIAREKLQPGFGDVSVAGWITWLVLAGIACAMSIEGDLFESAVKRRAGVKDSSNLLPGHGGVLDRVDALLPVLPLAALVFA